LKKHIVLAKLFEFGGSNSHLKVLIKYFGKENMVLVLEDNSQVQYLKNIDGADGIPIKINSTLHQYAHLRYRFTTNLKELFQIIKSIFTMQILSIKYGFADITICTVDPEKYLYFLWIPFSKAVYILHSAPGKEHTPFTSYTCNMTLGNRKKIISVSNANKNLICTNWSISNKKRSFVYVVPNCIIESELSSYNHLRPDKPDNRKQYIITLGHVIEYKNPMVWLEVAKLVTAKYPHVHFVWLGNGPLWNDFKTATIGNDRISFQGAVTDPGNYLKKAMIYYQPSLSETQGIAVIEAMYNYLPCVVSDTGGLPETVKNQFNGLVVNPSIVKEHAEALSTLIDNPELRAEYGINSHKRVLEQFSFDTFKGKMDALYRN